MIYLKNKLTKFSLLILLCFTFSNLFSQLSSNLNPNGERNILEDRSTWKEVESERKVFSSTYLTEDGRIIMHYSKRPINYYNSSSALVPINIKPASSTKGLTATNQPNAVSLLYNGAVEINTGHGYPIVFSKNTKINGVAVSTSQLKQNGVNATMQTNIPGITKTFEFRFNGLKYNYVLNSPIATSSSDFVIEEEITMPANTRIKPDQNYGRQDDRGWLGPLLIVADNGEELGSIRGAICYDANNNYITAAYKYEKVNGKQKVKIIVPNAWINDPARVYPITIDPLVTGPTATYVGPTIPSCISPASGSDSILVTIPAQVTVTGLFASGSYYADPFSTAIMNDGSMNFRTDCNTSSSFTTTAPAGLSPGTGFLTAFNLSSPLLCCKSQSCVSQTFYLSMHVTRTVGGSGCNNSFVYHNPLGGFPFEAYVEGRTVEAFGPEWSVTPANVCSDVCSITGTVFIRYGVPPFTITHPWMTGSVTAGTPAGCTTASTLVPLTLTVPNCPLICDTVSTLSVPPATVIDACGNNLTGLSAKSIGIIEVPIVTSSPITICSGETFNAVLSSCIPGSTFGWSGNATSGTGSPISQTLINNGSAVSSTNYQVFAENNTCFSDTITVTVNTIPQPIADFNTNPDPVITNTPILFTDNTTVFGGGGSNWYWTFGDGLFSFNQNPTHSYTSPEPYTVCLAIQTTDGCVDTICRDIQVVPAEIKLPNIVTPNGDDMNDKLHFKYLEFLGENTLKVFNRWGQLIYEKKNYLNDWSPTVSDGTYYYILTVENGDSYKSFLEVIK